MFHGDVTVVAETNDDDDDDDLWSKSDFLANVSRKGRARALEFEKGSAGYGQDSRYWDKMIEGMMMITMRM